MWSADIFDAKTLALTKSASFETYVELRGWLVALIRERPGWAFYGSFQIPANAPESHRKHLEILGPARSALN